MEEPKKRAKHHKGTRGPGPGLPTEFNLGLLKGDLIGVIKWGQKGASASFECIVVQETSRFITVAFENYKDVIDKFEVQRKTIWIERIDKMAKKLEAPPKEQLQEMCKQYPGKTKAIKEIAKQLQVSNTTVYNWIDGYEITEFGDLEKAKNDADNHEPEQQPPAPPSTKNFEEQSGEMEKQADLIIDEKKADPSKKTADGLVHHLTVAVYKVGTVSIIINYDTEKIMITAHEGMTFKEAAAVVSLIEEIL